ncbi:MAG: hypothetical protein CMH61_00210 [Nanoarchaeota archaeon]|nr:hypothetical protein [Nanoarchaeota archaeon]|tara:strand:+ start:95 stop:475 length:381 start_codon:yes stop_codon:yes gene_type:complete
MTFKITKGKVISAVIGGLLGIMANSVDVNKSEPYQFTSAPGLRLEGSVGSANGSGINRSNTFQDTTYELDLFGLRVPLAEYRAVSDWNGNELYSGRVDGDELQTADGRTLVLRASNDIPGYFAAQE